jgi:predicted P-loop ATPase
MLDASLPAQNGTGSEFTGSCQGRHGPGRAGDHPADLFLQALGKAPATARLRAFAHKDNPRRDAIGARKGPYDLTAAAAWNQEGRSVYIVINDGGDKAPQITSCRALFVEWDDMPAEWQVGAWQTLGLPEPSVMVSTGGKSIHVYWVLSEPLPSAEWAPLQSRLIAHAHADAACKDASRVMRLPGFRYALPDGSLGDQAAVIHQTGNRYSAAEIEVCLPPVLPPRPPLQVAPPITLHSTSDLPPRPVEVLYAALEKVPQFDHGQGRRDELLKLCYRLHVDLGRDAALAVMQEHSPAVRDMADYFKKPPSQISVGSLWPFLEENYGVDIRRHDLKGKRPPDQPLQLQPITSDQLGQTSSNGKGNGPAPAANKSKHRRLTAAQVLRRLPEALGGTPRLNSRTRFVELNGAVLTGDEIDRIYLDISTDEESWPKQTTTDAALGLAHRHKFDPVADYLEHTADNVAPLPLEQWQRLDQHLLGIDDPIAAAFLPQFLISAVARTYRPGCSVRRSPVLIGKQWRGKTAMGEILFGAEHWAEGLQGTSDRDIRARCHTVWGVELSELNGITRRSDQEHLKAFLTERVDILRRAYGKGEERNPRRFVFWGTSNGPPLRDLSGSTRFVCIPVPDRMLPLEWAEEHRDALWSRAVEQYRQIPAGDEPWDRVSEEERALIEERNSNHQEIDPWAEEVERILAEAKSDLRLPVSIPHILERLDIPRSQQTNATAARVRQLAERIGWIWARRRPAGGGNPKKGLWPAVPPVPTVCPPGGAQPNASADGGSGQVVPPVPTDSFKVENREEVQEQEQESAAQLQGLAAIGGHGGHNPPDPLQGNGSSVPGGGAQRGAQRGAQTPPPWFGQLVELRRTHPAALGAVLVNLLDPKGLWGIKGVQVAQWLPAADEQISQEAQP